MAGGEDEEAQSGNKRLFPPFTDDPHQGPSFPENDHHHHHHHPIDAQKMPVFPAPPHDREDPPIFPAPHDREDPPIFPAPHGREDPPAFPAPHGREDPPASTDDEPVNIENRDENYGHEMSEVLEKVGQEELEKTTPSGGPLSVTDNLSTDPDLPVFIKRKRGRPRKHPLPGTGTEEPPRPKRVGRPPKNASSVHRIPTRKIKREPSTEEPRMIEQMMEDEFSDHLPSEQSMANEDDCDENAIRFTDVGNHLPLLVSGHHLCAVCLSRHSHRQSSGMRRTRSTSFKRFTSVVCRACNKFLCVAPRVDGRTCFDIYHTLTDFVRADLPEFDRKESGDKDVISDSFDDSPDLTEDANVLLKLIQVASGELSKASESEDGSRRNSEIASSEESQEKLPTDLHSDPGDMLMQNCHEGSDREREDEEKERQEGQSHAINLLLKVLKNHRVLSVSDTLQLRLERRPKKYHYSTRNYLTSPTTVGTNSFTRDLTRQYRRKGRPRKHVTSDEDEGELSRTEDTDPLTPSTAGSYSDLHSALFTDIITPGKRFKYACGRCGAEFNLMARMKMHMKVHIERKTYSCNICSATFRTKGKLAEHKKNHKSEKIHQCPKCEESFKKMILLRRHMREHQEVKPYQCRICGSRFSYASSLKEHAINKHLGERPFKCSECDQGFTRQINLLEHMRMHTGERPFKCSKCDQSFARKSGLKSHMISHTGEKKHVCSTCGARFRHKIALTEHQRTHTGEKPFECQHCGQRFAASTTLRNHVRLHTGEKPHKCKVCGAGFAQRTSLNCHMKKHGINTSPESKTMRNNWTKNYRQSQEQDQDVLQPGGGLGGGEQIGGQAHSMSHSVDQLAGTPQPHDYSDKHLTTTSGGGSGGGSSGHSNETMMAQAVSMAFTKMVPDMLQGSMVLPRRPDPNPTPPLPPGASTTTLGQTLTQHHQVNHPQPTHHSMVSSHRSPLDTLSSTPHPSTNPGRASVPHHEVHELERPASHSNHGGELKVGSAMPLTSTASPWSSHNPHSLSQSHDPTSNLPAFPFDPSFHQQMTQGFPGVLPGQPNHGYPEQPRFPFDNRFGMDAWPAHTNWKHKYQ